MPHSQNVSLMDSFFLTLNSPLTASPTFAYYYFLDLVYEHVWEVIQDMHWQNDWIHFVFFLGGGGWGCIVLVYSDGFNSGYQRLFNGQSTLTPFSFTCGTMRSLVATAWPLRHGVMMAQEVETCRIKKKRNGELPFQHWVLVTNIHVLFILLLFQKSTEAQLLHKETLDTVDSCLSEGGGCKERQSQKNSFLLV